MQDVLTALVQKMPEFTYDAHKSFRRCTRTLTLNRWRNNQKQRGKQSLAGDPTALATWPVPTPAIAFWETEYRQHLVARALELIQAEFQPTTWRACWEFVAGDKTAAQVAALGMSENAVYLANGRVLHGSARRSWTGSSTDPARGPLGRIAKNGLTGFPRGGASWYWPILFWSRRNHRGCSF